METAENGLVTCHLKLLVAYVPARSCSLAGNLDSWGRGRGYTALE